MIIGVVASLLFALIWLWRRTRKAAKRRAATVTAAPLVQAMGGTPVYRSVPGRFKGSRGSM